MNLMMENKNFICSSSPYATPIFHSILNTSSKPVLRGHSKLLDLSPICASQNCAAYTRPCAEPAEPPAASIEDVRISLASFLGGKH